MGFKKFNFQVPDFFEDIENDLVKFLYDYYLTLFSNVFSEDI